MKTDDLFETVTSRSLPGDLNGRDEVHVCTCPYCGKSYPDDMKPVPSRQASEDESECCMRCGFEWKARTDSPLKCPKCGSYAWNRPTVKCLCKMCGHKWTSRMPGGPAKCPECKSNRWDKGPVRVDDRKLKDISHEELIGTRERWVCKKYSEGLGCVQIASETGLPFFRVMEIVRKYTGSRSVKV